MGEGRVPVALQAAAALGLPLVVGRILLPGDLVAAVASVAVAVVFCAVHRWRPLTWLVPASALVSVTPAIPGVVAVVLAALALAALVARPPDVASGGALRWGAAGVLVGAGVLLLGATLLQVRSADAEFVAGQQAMEEAWDAPLIVAEPSTSDGQPLTDGDVSPQPGAPESTATTPAPAAEGTSDETAEDGGAPSDPVFTPVPLAALEFRRPDDDARPVTSDRLFVGSDISEGTLTQGPGHYPTTAQPGGTGNFAVAGHRTGWGAPFYSLDELRRGDEIVVADRGGNRYVYVVDGAEVVRPTDSWVLSADPLGTGQPTITLTTCDPPGVNTDRLVVFGTLRSQRG